VSAASCSSLFSVSHLDFSPFAWSLKRAQIRHPRTSCERGNRLLVRNPAVIAKGNGPSATGEASEVVRQSKRLERGCEKEKSRVHRLRYHLVVRPILLPCSPPRSHLLNHLNSSSFCVPRVQPTCTWSLRGTQF
jgi:hypothetical protein